jgi:CRP-like cAMP-binding protein
MTPTVQGSADSTWNPATPWAGWTRWIAQVPLFSALPKKEQKKVAALAQLKSFADGKTIVREGAAGTSFFAILGGGVRLTTQSGVSRELKEGGYFGELALLDGAPRAATVVAVGDVTTARIERPAFLELLRQEPLIAYSVALGIVKMVRELEKGMPPRPATGAEAAADPEELVRAGKASRGAARLVAPLLAGVPLFAELPQKRLAKVARLAEVKEYKAGAAIARQGAHGGAFYVLAAGRAEAVTPDGKGHVMDTGTFFGELSLLDGGPRAATVTALDDVVAVRLARPDLVKLLDEEPTISLGLVKGLVARFRDVERQSAG